MLNNKGESHLCLVSNFNRNSFNVPPFTIMLVADFGSIINLLIIIVFIS